MTEAERISLLIRHLAGGNIAEFARKIGASKPSVWRMQKGQVGIRLKTEAILEAFPQIDREWLVTGEGYPGDLSVNLVREHYERRIKTNERIIDNLIKRIEDLEKQIETNS
jgi:hypothetical protein